MTRGRRRQIDTSHHFCPNPDCVYRGWVGWGNLRANGHPNGGPWLSDSIGDHGQNNMIAIML